MIKRIIAAAVSVVMLGALTPSGTAVADDASPALNPGQFMVTTPDGQRGPAEVQKTTAAQHAPKGNPAVSPAVRSAASQRRSACPSACFFYGTGTQFGTGDLVATNLTVEKPYLRTTGTNPDFHSLAEIAAIKPSVGTGVCAPANGGRNIVEVGWTVDQALTGSLNPHLFVYHWICNQQTCYNACGWVDYAPTTMNAGDVMPSWGLVSKAFGIQYFSNAWWVSYDGNWLGYFPDSVWTTYTQPQTTFTTTTTSQAFWELAAGSTTPCSDLGNGQLGTSGGANTSAARLGSWTLREVPTDLTDNFTPITFTGPSAEYDAYIVTGSTRTARGGGPGYNAAGTAAGSIGSC